jgi:Na+/proline symporter
VSDESAAVPDSAAGPRIPWRRIAAVHVGAGALVAFISVLFIFDFEAQAVPLGLLAALIVTALAALPPFLGALFAHRLAIRRGRDRRREILAVVLGALIGSIVPVVVFSIWLGVGSPESLGFTGLVAVASAAGFAIWVLVAWRRRRMDAEAPEHSLN